MLPYSLLPSLTGESEPEGIFPTLTLRQRIYGWLGCYAGGVLITVMSFGSFRGLLVGKPYRFAILYTVGNLIALMSTMFLVGPKKQWEKMVDSKRKTATLVYLVSMFATLGLCFEAPDLRILILVAVIVQWLALLWYSLSFIPFGRTVFRRLIS